VALRLGKRIRVGGEVDGEVVGLAGYDCGRCSAGDKLQRGCHLDGRRQIATRKGGITIDYHQPPRPEDTIYCCPSSIPGIHDLQRDVYALAEYRERGGLRDFFGLSLGELAEAMVDGYCVVDDACERLTAEVRAAGRKKPGAS
jgi:hypothetical protein